MRPRLFVGVGERAGRGGVNYRGVGLIVLLLTALGVLAIIASAVVAWSVTHPPRRTAGSMVAHNLPSDPAQAGARFSEREIIDASGAAVPVWDVEGLCPDGPTLILLHGWGDSRYGGLLWLDVLRPRVSRVLLMDLRGHGDSAHRRFTWGKREIDDVRRIIHWAGSTDPRPVVLMGYSMGANLAVRCAADSQQVAAVVADSPVDRPVDAIRAVIRLHGVPAWPTAEVAALMLPTCGLRRSLLAAAQRLTCPLLVLHGEADTITPIAMAERLSVAPACHALERFAAAEHLQGIVTEPERYTRALGSFLQSLR